MHGMYLCSDINARETAKMHEINDNTELTHVTLKETKHLHILSTSITFGNAQFSFKQSVMNFGFTLDCCLTMNQHVSIVAQACYYELRYLVCIARFLTRTSMGYIVHRWTSRSLIIIIIIMVIFKCYFSGELIALT